MARMAGSAYREAVWQAVEPGGVPEDFERRRTFLLEHVRPGQRVLDVGCGAGEFSVELARAGAVPVAVDVAEEALRRARAAWPAKEGGAEGLDARRWAPGEPLPLDDAEVDVVWAGEVIEHVLDVQGFVSELRRVLRPRGTLALTTPNLGRMGVAALALRARALDARFDPRSDHVRFFTPRTLAALLEELGFDGVSVRAVGGPPGLRRSLHALARRGRW